jgi:bacterioferritin-associated ferredoxin
VQLIFIIDCFSVPGVVIVCHCHAVSDRRIRELVRAGAASVRDVSRRTGAGNGCGGCLSSVRQIVEREAHAAAQDANADQSSVTAAG